MRQFLPVDPLAEGLQQRLTAKQHVEPAQGGFVPGRAENWSAQVANTMAQFTAKKQATFVDMDRCIEQTGVDMSTDTLDGSTHLNMYGAQALSHWLGGYLRENYDLPDRRGQAEYDAVWTPVLEQYDAQWKSETETPTGW